MGPTARTASTLSVLPGRSSSGYGFSFRDTTTGCVWKGSCLKQDETRFC